MVLIATQAEWDALPESYPEFTEIRITGSITITKIPGNATIEAGDNATVRAWGNATVQAGGNATIEAWGYVCLRVTSTSVKVALYGFAVCYLFCALNVEVHSTSVTVIRPKIETAEQWLQMNVLTWDSEVVLYKRVSQ